MPVLTTAFQANAFQNNAFQIVTIVVIVPASGDLSQLDKGLVYQSIPIYLGPTLGWRQTIIRQQQFYTASTTLGPLDSVVLCNHTAAITINLPDVTKWNSEFLYNPYNSFERSLWIKDMSGAAFTNNITVVPFGTQTIDGLAQHFVISLNHGLLRLYPRSDLSGWYAG